MSDRIVDEAYQRVRNRYSDEAWSSLPPRSLTDEIYKEIRRIDAERARAHDAPGAECQFRNSFAA